VIKYLKKRTNNSNYLVTGIIRCGFDRRKEYETKRKNSAAGYFSGDCNICGISYSCDFTNLGGDVRYIPMDNCQYPWLVIYLFSSTNPHCSNSPISGAQAAR